MQEFKHSIKVPRNYKLAANILQKALTEGASVKSLVFNDKLKHYRTNVLYALISEAIKHNAVLDIIFDGTKILENESRLDPWLAKILATELLYGKQCLPGKSKPETTIASYKDKFQEFLPDVSADTVKKGVRRPRYVRINTNLLTTSDAIREFQSEEYRFVRCTSGSYSDYLEQVASLGEYDFMQDYHVKTVFVFAPGTKLHEHPLYLENKIILQDKATALAVHLLAPPTGSVVMDMCAAPGMKTTQLAAYMRNQGTIYAIERNEDRYKILCDFVEKTGSTCVKTLHKDSLDIKKGEYPDVEYVLLDPSCSGSGMDLCGHSYVQESRLARLTSLQEKFLKHAMHAFPNVKKIVYSTCSLFPQENERVITNVVSQCRVKWKVLNVKELLKDQWNNVGSGMYGTMGSRCLYARPDTDLTTGFFLAVLEKDAKYFLKENEHTNYKSTSVTKNKECDEKMEESEEPKIIKKKLKNLKSVPDVVNVINDEIEDESLKKKKKTKKQSHEAEEIVANDDSENKKNKKKQKSKIQSLKDEETNGLVDDDSTSLTNEISENCDKKKGKKKRHIDDNELGNVITSPEELSLKRKKKKRKDEIILSEDDIVVITETKIEKKRNKRNLKDAEIESSRDTEEFTESVSNKKEKIIQINNLDYQEAPKKKKKKCKVSLTD